MTTNRIRAILKSQVTATCVVVFLADVVTGTVAPTFSIFAEQLGISVAIIGVLNMVTGLTQLTTSIPIGSFSDRTGRPRWIRGGMVSFVAATLLLALAEDATLLFLARVLLALGMVSVFRIAAAHLGDVTPAGGRSLAFGAYATSLGLGFTTGSFFGGQVAGAFSARIAYFGAAGIAALGFLLAWRLLRELPEEERSLRHAGRLRDGLRLVARDRMLMLVNFGNFLVSVTFVGAITTFFPLYGKELLLTEGTIGTMFALRGIVSTLGRAPNGVLARIVGNQAVMLGALAAEVVVLFGIWSTEQQGWLMLFLGLEGFAFGAYLVASQTFIADNVGSDVRGAAVGLNATASGTGATLAPLLLGLVAGQWGVATVFPVTGCVLAAGFLASLIGTLAVRRGDAMGQVAYR